MTATDRRSAAPAPQTDESPELIPQAHRDVPARARTFSAAAAALIACFVSSSAPIPMMSVWEERLSLTTSDVALTVVSYFVGCIAVLVFFARLSNALGRKPVTAFALLLGAGASAVFAFSDSVAALHVGRFLQGLSCGFASSAVMSWVVDTAPPKKAWLGTAVTAGGPNIGLCLGTLLTGVLLETESVAPEALFEGLALLLLTVGIFTLTGTETVPRGMESVFDQLIPRVVVPSRLRRLFVVAGAAFVGTWGLGSFFQGFSARLASEAFGESGTFLAALTYLLLIGPNAVTGLIVGRFNAVSAQRVVMLGFLTGGSLVFLAIALKSPLLFLPAVALCGAMSGGACTSGLKLLLEDTTLRERAGVISALYLLAYVGAGLPNLAVGQWARNAELTDMAPGYILWMLVSAAVVWVTLQRIARRPNAAEVLRLPKRR